MGGGGGGGKMMVVCCFHVVHPSIMFWFLSYVGAWVNLLTFLVSPVEGTMSVNVLEAFLVVVLCQIAKKHDKKILGF